MIEIPSQFADEAKALANSQNKSSWHPVPCPESDNPDPTFYDDFVTEDLENATGSTNWLLHHIPGIFDSGHELCIRYKRNPDVVDCSENEALCGDGGGLSYLVAKEVLQHLPSSQPHPRRKFHVDFFTNQDGTHHFDITETDLQIRGHALDQFENISLPFINISSLRQKYICCGSLRIHVVTVNPEDDQKLLVFKEAFPPDVSLSFPRELSFLQRLPHSDFLLHPTAVIVDDTHLLRGYLIPYHPASSLNSLFHLSSCDSVSISPFQPMHGPFPSHLQRTHNRPRISWPLRLLWAAEAVAAIAFLHSQAIFWGDVKVDNIVLCTDGHCRLIDYFPHGYSEDWAPPEFPATIRSRPARDIYTPEHDVFSLGLLLWAIGEEVFNFVREVPFVEPVLLWSIDGHVPDWYRQLAQSCLNPSPVSRMKVDQLLAGLKVHV
ncbi:hypothetical protein GYMLUDRAFT_75436 [Collybiopsis luxurians FD-317 M1]|uniref:Protein kinase domain-containing protein n=1 Tax=Collybiopsis luxurians FD-317 M1 TaxID=944289 RepID=A0A0D0BRJ0_9AGAR|nr:hypothetical protein GYMLUDRAFT_75436 [Collybiopsis luxurians FD-317 M1]